MQVKVSLYLYPVVTESEGIAGVWDRFAEQLIAAQRTGFHGVWTPEHHVARAFFPPVHQILTWCSAKAPELAVGTAVALPALHHPLRLAEEIAGLVGLTGGKFRWGVGYGFRPREFNSVAAPIEQKIPHAREVVRTTCALLRGEQQSFEIGPWRSDGGSLSAALPTPPPVLWGVRSTPGVKAIANQSDGILPGMLEGHMRQLELLDEFDEAHGGEAALRPLLTDVVIADSDTEATRRALRRLGEEYGSFRHHRSLTPDVDAFAKNPDSELDRLRSIAVVGGADDVRALLELCASRNVGEVIFRVEQASTTRSEALEAIAAVGEVASKFAQ